MPPFEVILTNQAPLPSSGYSQAIRLGNLVVTSGYLGTHPDGSGLVPGGFEAELRQAIANIQAVLRAAGCSLADVVRVNVSLIDVNRFAEMDRIYREYFTPPYPTRNTIGVKELWGGAQVGLDVWAVCSDRCGSDDLSTQGLKTAEVCRGEFHSC